MAPPGEELAVDGLPVTPGSGFSRRQTAGAISARSQWLILLPTEKCNFRRTYCYEDFEFGNLNDATQRTVMLHGMNQLSTGVLFVVTLGSAKGGVTSVCLPLYSLKGMNMNLMLVKKLMVAFVATIIFSSLGAFHGTASAQVPFVVPGIDVTAPPWNCREEFVD